MESDAYVNIEALTTVANVWDTDQLLDSEINLDVLLPNGYFLTLNVKRNVTLREIKEEVWETAQHCPLFGLLQDSDAYVFQCVNFNTAERDELVDEDRILSEVKPFQAVLRLVEKKGDPEEKKLNSRLGKVIGQSLKEIDAQKNPEICDFRKQMKYFCESVCAVLDQETWEKRVLRQYPVSIESTPTLPNYLQKKLFDDNLVVCVSIGHQGSELTFKLSISPSINAKELLDVVVIKKGQSIGLQNNHIRNHILKICGLEEYLIGSYPLAQYRYIRESISSDKIPELLLVSRETVQLEKCSEKIVLERQRSRSLTSDSATSMKRTKSATLSAWTIEEPLAITLHSVHNLNCDNKIKIAVQCAIYHGDERLCKIINSSEKSLEEDRYVWEDNLAFDLEVYNLPRMAKLCFCIYEVSPTQKNSRFRKCQDKFACPIAWVNTTVFDYKDILKATPISLSVWPYPQEMDEMSSVMLRSLGYITKNQGKDQGILTFSFKKYHPTMTVVYPNTEEILENAKEDCNGCNGSVRNGNMPQASKSHLQQLRQICEKDTLYQLHEQDKQLMWFLRTDCCEQLPNSLPKLLRCVKWNDRREIAQMTMLIEIWPLLTPYKALELLDYAYPDTRVRTFAVKCLQAISDEELSMYLLQLVQALKHESYLQNSLVKFLLERALENRHIGHRLFWLLRAETDFPESSLRFRLILEAYCRSLPAHLEALEKQVEALNKLKSANHHVQSKVNVKKEGREKVKVQIQDLLRKDVHKNPFHDLQNPLDPRFKFGKIRIEKCKFLDSKMKPLWLVFENTDSYGKDVFLIFKNGDDLRQDMLTLQMIRIMDRLWKNEGLDLRMIPYQCLATGHKVGLIEVVPDSDTIANIQKEKGFTATSAFKKGSILAWLRDHNPDDISLSKASEEFTLSCAGYCVATYVLGVADRHSDNIMVKTNGQLFHVDFGHILGKFKEKFGIKRERVPFVLTHDFVYIITKGHTQKSQEFTKFQQYCERAFMILRRKGPLVISLFAMMLSTGIPELSSEKDLEYLRDTLVLDRSDQDALNHFRLKFDEALKNSWKTSVNWMAHNWAKDNKMSD